MKIVPNIACVLLACFGTWLGSAQELEKPAAVKAENIDCPQVVLRHQNDKFIAEFQIRALPDSYNRYQTILGEEEIQAELSPLLARRATWLIVMDTSDPGGRKLTIDNQKRGLARFLSFVSPQSRVGLYRLSRELVPVYNPSHGGQLPLGIGMSEAIMVPQSRNKFVWNNTFASIPAMYPNMDKNDNSQMNTNLWVGLLRALREELPKLAQGHYANLPKGILLISDGVDESHTSEHDLDMLIQEARKLGVPIHTLGYAHKDQGKGMDIVSRHQGFSHLQRLSSETGGLSLSYDMFDVDGESAILLRRIAHATEAALLNLIFPISELKSGQDITLQLLEGQQKCLGRLNVSQYDVAQVLGDYWLKNIYAMTNKARRADEGDKDKLYIILGQSILKLLATLPIRDDLFNYTDVDEPFARRTKQILAHLDSTPELQKQAQDSSDSMIQLCQDLAKALINFGAPLPEPRKETTIQQQPIIINNTSSTTSNEPTYEKESIQDWVWWSLGLGGSVLSILFFWIITRLVNRPETFPVDKPAESKPYAESTQPVLASLVNTANPAQRWVVSSTSCRVGRHSSNEVSLPFSYVSGVQFILSRSTSGLWELRDAQSTNGTMVNGKKVKTVQLNSGDIIRIADLELEFKLR